MEITLVTENSKVRYVGDGARVEFTYDFNPIDLNYVKVYKNLVEVNSPDITVSPGVVTFEVAPLAGDTIVIMRDMPLTYAKGIVSKGIINSDSLDNLAVELLGQIQQVNEKLSRTPTYPLDTSLTGEEIFSEFNQNVQSVKDAKDIVNGKVEEVNSAVSSGLNEITEVTSESQTAITEEKNSAISEIQSTTEGIIQRAETAADEAEASAQAAATSASLAQIENKISNCITKIPQDIKLELNNGTLTLKAGSQPIDGQGNVINIDSDKTTSYSSIYNGLVVVVTKNSKSLVCIQSPYVTSGETSPTVPSVNRQLWYDTTNKIVKMYAPNESTYSETSLPIALVNTYNVDKFEIDQVFNGFGFIGSHWYYTEGVSGRDMNGRNADGSLNSVLHTASSPGVFQAGAGTGKYYLFTDLCSTPRNSNDYVTFWQDDKPATTTGNYGVWISQRDNFIRYTNDKGVTWNPSNWIYCGWYEVVDGKITNFKMKQPIKLADEQDVALLNGNNKYTGFNNYTQPITVDTNPINFVAQNSNIEAGVTPTSYQFCGYDWRGKDGNRLAWLGVVYGNQGTKRIEFQKHDASLTELNLTAWATKVATPATSANGYEAVNASWANTKLNAKQNTITGAATTIASNNLTAGRALISDGSGKVAASGVSSAELGYLDGVTSAIQTQLNTKANLASPAFSGTPTVPTPAVSTNNTQAINTQWFNQKIQVVSALPSSPNANVYYFIPE